MKSGKCRPTCPFLRCAKKMRMIRKRGGRTLIICGMTGDLCIGYKCNFAYCEKHALLPDGTCALTIKRRTAPSIEEEAAKLEQQYVSIKSKLKKLGKGLDDLI